MAVFNLYEVAPDLQPIKIVDIGAAWSERHKPPSYAGLLEDGRVELIGFEPDLESCADLVRRFGPPHRFLPLFIGGGGPAKFYRAALSDCSSLYRPNAPLLGMFNHLPDLMSEQGVMDVDTVRLDDIEQIGDIDFLKLDVQGAELDVLKGGERALAAAVAVQTEVEFVELYENQPLFAEVDRHLRAHGFWFHSFIDMGSMSFKPIQVGSPDHGLNQRLWSDAIYVRHPLRFAALATDKLRKLAVILHHLYGSYDLALQCLKAADAQDGAGLAPRYYERLSQSQL